jgi:hypothetical protein
MANICRGLRKKNFFSPVLKSPTHIGFIGVKKNGSKISHLGTFKVFYPCYSQVTSTNGFYSTPSLEPKLFETGLHRWASITLNVSISCIIALKKSDDFIALTPTYAGLLM